MRILFPSCVHEQWRQPPNLVAVRPGGTGPTRLTHFFGAPVGVIGAVRAAALTGEPANADASCSMCLSELWSQHGEPPSSARHSKDRALARAAPRRCRLR